ncbi:MAG TPA: IclR family transcriptional regulator [Acidimicrobiia bacterium]|nr:IclR family transcriptional regulator [Acidimicrobiia bacterium]
MPTRASSPAAASGLLLTLNRGIGVLEEIANEQGRATAKSLAAALDINLGTCYQLLRTLQANGYIHRLPGGRYGLGSRIGFLADHYQASTAPPPEFVDILHELHQAIEETAYVSIRRGRKIEIAAVLEGTKALRVGNLTVGYGDHPHIRASVKAFLAGAREETVDELLEGVAFEALTPNTITDRTRFLAELEATRLRGYGVDDEEFAEGVSCIGAVVLDGSGEPIGAYGTSFPAGRLAGDGAAIAKEVMAAAENASRALGYEGPYPVR